MTSTTSQNLPASVSRVCTAALVFAAFCLLIGAGSTRLVTNAIEVLGVDPKFWILLFGACCVATTGLFWPALKASRLDREANAARAKGDGVQTRIATAAALEQAQLTFGWGVFALLMWGFVSYIFMNGAAVGKTFFLLPLMQAKWVDVTTKFITINVALFCIAEVLVLIWGLIVALGRLVPGAAGQPIRFLATLYCDVFRGLPGIVTLYLIGFGIPTSGLPDLFVPHIYGWFHDTSTMSVQELKSATRIPVFWWCAIALTLTYGAYVAEVYRSGITSIHWSQVSAARSLGLSYMQTMRYVIVPQAVKRIMAPLLNDFIGLQKDTALVQIVGLIDAFNQSKISASAFFNLSPVTIVAALFVLVTIPQARFVDHLLERDAARTKAGGV
jgi:polar amino acid transport system permease protein